MKSTRADFLKRLIRLLMISILAFIAIVLGNKAVTGADCSDCPGNGVCNGKSDCNKY